MALGNATLDRGQVHATAAEPSDAVTAYAAKAIGPCDPEEVSRARGWLAEARK